jgi:hypothetical protein
VLQPEGPLTLARPTTVLWLEELSEAAVLAAMKAGRGYVTESPTGPHLEISVNDTPMGGVVAHGSLRAKARVRGAMGDLLGWIDAEGVINEEPITAEDFEGQLDLPSGGTGFIRAEVIARQSRERLIEDFRAAATERGVLPWQLQDSEFGNEPIRRAISNPVYLQR